MTNAKLILNAALKRCGYTASLMRAKRTQANVDARAEVWATMRACRSKSCVQLSWPEIAKACGFAHHTTVMQAAKRHGEVAEWRLD